MAKPAPVAVASAAAKRAVARDLKNGEKMTMTTIKMTRMMTMTECGLIARHCRYGQHDDDDDDDGEDTHEMITRVRCNATLTLRSPPQLWSPEAPNLHGVVVRLHGPGGVLIDTVRSYIGLRTVALQRSGSGHARLILNGKPRFSAGVLDQGYWPDGVYTAPSDEALSSDITAAKRLGFDLVRVKMMPSEAGDGGEALPTNLMLEGKTPVDIAEILLDGLGMEPLDQLEPSPKCECSEEKLVRSLRLLPREEVDTILEEEGKVEARCQFCGKVYRMGPEEVEKQFSLWQGDASSDEEWKRRGQK